MCTSFIIEIIGCPKMGESIAEEKFVESKGTS